MLVRVKIVGGGTQADPIRVPFPTYRMVEDSPSNGKVVVEVPDEDLPEGLLSIGPADKQMVGTKLAVVNLPQPRLEKLYAHLDGRYRQHAGKFRPEIG